MAKLQPLTIAATVRLYKSKVTAGDLREAIRQVSSEYILSKLSFSKGVLELHFEYSTGLNSDEEEDECICGEEECDCEDRIKSNRLVKRERR